MIFLERFSLTILIGLFAASAVAVWFGGSRLARYVDALTTKTGAGQALMGMLLLGGLSSLPEVAAVSTSAAMGNASLAVNNLLGTASINILILVIADIVYGRDALTSVAARPVTLMQGVLAMLLAGIVAMVVTVGDIPLFGFGVGGAALAMAAVVALWMSSNFERRHVWQVVHGADEDIGDGEGYSQGRRSLSHLLFLIALCGLLILVGGFVLSSSADAITTKTGLAAGLVGFLLIGLGTSLPEISTVTAAIRLRRYQMAIGDIFGTNIFNMMLIFLADLVYTGGPVLAQAGRFEVIGSILSILMTGIFVVGLLERRDRTVLRMGYDAFAAMIVFVIGIWFLARSGG